MANYKWSDDKLDSTGLQEIMLGFPEKMGWFISKGYLPHYYQALFHCDSNDEKVTRFRHLIAGRRGGKTLSAAWEVLFYCLFPAQFHLDAHGKEKDTPYGYGHYPPRTRLGDHHTLLFVIFVLMLVLSLVKTLKRIRVACVSSLIMVVWSNLSRLKTLKPFAALD
jgi:hypothetical protein